MTTIIKSDGPGHAQFQSTEGAGQAEQADAARRQKADMDGAGKSISRQERAMPAPIMGSKLDMMAVMAKFEELILLMTKMTHESKVADRQSEIAALKSKIADLLSAAKEKEKGAKEMRNSAIVSLVISVVAASLSFISACVQLKGVKAGAAEVKALPEAAEGTSAMDLAKLKNDTFSQGAKEFSAKAEIWDAVGKGVAPGASYASSHGQAESQMSQARADTLQARAEEAGTEATRSQQRQQEWSELLSKLYELLQQYYSAQDKIANSTSN